MTLGIHFGADRVAARPALLRGSRFALATNDAARSAYRRDLRTRVLLLAAGVNIVRLFSPEHGLDAYAPDGEGVGDAVDAATHLPVFSLYGERYAPPPEALADVDAVLFDIPCIGTRCYTYNWTLTHLIDACADAHLPLYVLDRPNPLGGRVEDAEGPLLEPAHYSFIGAHSIPLRHSLTIGELGRLWQRERRPDADVRVIECSGWSRGMLWPDTGLEFVPTSPAIRCFEAALLYPGLVLFEATNLSVGRGTAESFQAVGAPWLDAAGIAGSVRLAGIELQATSLTPSTGPHAGMRCNGVLLRVTDARAVRPVRAGLELLHCIRERHPTEFTWAAYPTVANPSGTGHLERLLGTALPDDADFVALTASPGWAERLESVRLYS